MTISRPSTTATTQNGSVNVPNQVTKGNPNAFPGAMCSAPATNAATASPLFPCSTSIGTNVATSSSLSASGSSAFPRSVTMPRVRANHPSK